MACTPQLVRHRRLAIKKRLVRLPRQLVPRLPLASLLLESDSPVLGPDAEARNEPANLVVGLTKVAELAGTGEEELAQQIEESTARVFPLLAAVGRG